MPPEAGRRPAHAVGLLLAGGLARRMGGGDKCLRPLAGKPILSHILDRMRPQVSQLVLNANGDPARFAGFGLPVVADSVEGFAGPLAGILAGLDWAAEHAPGTAMVISVPSDAPFLPRDLAECLVGAARAEAADIVLAASGGQQHPVVGLWPVELRQDLRRALVDENIRKVDVFTQRYRTAEVDFPVEPVDPFFNANRPEDLAEAEAQIAAGMAG